MAGSRPRPPRSMNSWTLLRRSLRFHARSHLGVVLGSAIGAATLTGAMLVGDSVRGSLRDRALERLGGSSLAITSGDRFFDGSLAGRLASSLANVQVLGILQLQAVATRPDSSARASPVQLYGVDQAF